MDDSLSLELAALSQFELAVMCFDAQGVCSYANAAAQQLVGRRRLPGLQLAALFTDPRERERVLAQLGRRIRGEAATYETTFTKPDEGDQVPVHVYAFPVLGADGTPAGSMAIVTDLRQRRVRQAMHGSIESLRSAKEIFMAVAGELRKLLAFDNFRVTALSADHRHLRLVFATDPQTMQDYPVGWWKLPEDAAGALQPKPWILDIATESQPDGMLYALAQRDAWTDKFMRSGVRWTLTLPIISEAGIRGFIGLDSRDEQPFTEADIEACTALPLSEAVKMGFQRQKENQLQACVDLVRQLGSQCIDLQRVADLIVTGLAAQFEWDHVAIYEHQPERHTLELLSQAGTLVPAHHRTVPENCGLIGRALQEQRDINVPDVNARSAPDADAYHENVAGMVSSLAMRIPGEPTRWILNAESRLASAFIDDELGMLTLLMAEVGQVLDHISLLETRLATLNALRDAVIETDRQGFIRYINPAGCELLQVKAQDMTARRCIQDFVPDPEIASALLHTQGFPRRNVTMVDADGKPFPALLSGARLAHDVGGLVFVASDLTHQVDVERTEDLKDVFRHASLEGRVPLAIASGWLNELARGRPELADDVDRILQQVRKADLPLERLLRLADPHGASAAPETPLDFRALVEDVLQQFSPEEREDIRLDLPVGAVQVRGAGEDLRFCVETSLSFAFRTKPQNRQVQVQMKVEDGHALLSVGGDWKPALGAEPAPGVRQRWRRTAASDLALAEGVIEEIVERASGNFATELDDQLRLSIVLPVARGA